MDYLETIDSTTQAATASMNDSGDNYAVDGTVDIKITNNYDSSVQTGERSRYPWKYVAEPYRPSRLTIDVGSFSEEETYTSDSVTWFKWLVDGHVQGYGDSIDVLFSELGEHEIVVAMKGADIEASPKFVVFKVMVKYVRREIRRLTDLDRESYFNAVQLMSYVPTEVGQSLYGLKYKSKDYFNRLHLYYGGTNDCDHWHAGAGFVTSHVTLTLEFEQSVQAIFPSLSQPYWDFTLESTFYDAREWRRSYIFSETWFGNVNPDNDLHVVTQGRWAYTPAMTDARDFSQVYNSYGVLRAPWNADPTPFNTRSMEVYGLENNLKPSGCVQYYVATQKDNWMNLAQQLTAAAHGHIHETVGGTWQHNLIPERIAEGNTPLTAAVYGFMHTVQALSKISWRKGVTTCPAECSMDTAAADCECKMDEEKYGDTHPATVLEEAGVLPYATFYDQEGRGFSSFYKDDEKTEIIYDQFEGLTKDQTLQMYTDMRDILTRPGHIGDMFQATSSNDITFWVLHGTVDRLWHFKQLGNQNSYDKTWTHNNTCYCHNPQDYQPFKNIFDVDEKYYTNEELVDLLAADRSEMPYMYEHFDWTHCKLLGYNMDNSHFTYNVDTNIKQRSGSYIQT
jgi:hypothetical protein